MNQYFPGKKYIPSQAFTFYKLQQTFERNPVIICLRSYKEWKEVLDDLGYNGTLYRTNSYLNTMISPNNLSKNPEAWKAIQQKFQ